MFQEITIIGDLGREPEMRYTPSGQAVTNFNVATTNKWTGSDGESHSETTWFRISVWGSMAEACKKYLVKGSRVLVKGMVSCHTYEKKDKTWESTLEIKRATTVKFLDKLGGGAKKEPEGGEREPYYENYSEEEIPGFMRD